MLFLEEHARWLLVMHTLLAAALVASSTHLVVWMWGYRKGRFRPHRSVQRFAVISAALFALTFVVGNLMYPVYKVRVRAEYLEHGSALTGDYRQRLESRARVHIEHRRLENARGAAPAVSPSEIEERYQPRAEVLSRTPRRAAKMARWFDVKEHWIALGLALSIGVMVIVLWWNPRRDGDEIAPVVLAMAAGAAATTWLAAIIGILVASFRSIGGFG